jgi:hypothetical protein
LELLEKRYNEACIETNLFLNTLFQGVKDLGQNDLRDYSSHKFTKGWELSLDIYIDKKKVSIYFLVDSQFPYSRPRVAIKEPNLYLIKPHIESNLGVVCLLPLEVEHNFLEVKNLVKVILKETYRYLNQEFSSKDFHREILNYWSRENADKDYYIADLDNSEDPRKIQYNKLVNKNGLYFHEIDSVYSSNNLTYLFNISQPLLPKDYPKSFKQLKRLLEREGFCTNDLVNHYKKTVCDPVHAQKLPVLLSSEINSNKVYFGMLFPLGSYFGRGFRKNEKSLYVKSSNDENAKRFTVNRTDHSWIFGRGVNKDLEILASKKIVLLGAGSVGSGCARYLAEAGFKNVEIIDHDKLVWANIARHELGAQSVYLHKAEELVKSLNKKFPTINFQYHNSRWEEVENIKSLLVEADMIISTTANWNSECLLNDFCKEKGIMTPRIYAWLEPYASVGHALFLRDNILNYQDFFDQVGNFTYAVTSFETKAFQEAGCGHPFNPYGSTKLSSLCSSVVDLVIDIFKNKIDYICHRLVLNNRDYINENNGGLTNWGESIYPSNLNFNTLTVDRKLDVSDLGKGLIWE